MITKNKIIISANVQDLVEIGLAENPKILRMDHSGLDELLAKEGIFCKPEFNLS